MDKNTHPLTPAEIATNSPETIERLRGNQPDPETRDDSAFPGEPVASFRLYLGLNDRHGRAVDTRALADAFALLDHAHEAYTRTNARGVWKGQPEPTAVVEIIQPDTDENREQLRATARTLAGILDQECVALAIHPLAVFELHHGTNHANG